MTDLLHACHVCIEHDLSTTNPPHFVYAPLTNWVATVQHAKKQKGFLPSTTNQDIKYICIYNLVCICKCRPLESHVYMFFLGSKRAMNIKEFRNGIRFFFLDNMWDWDHHRCVNVKWNQHPHPLYFSLFFLFFQMKFDILALQAKWVTYIIEHLIEMTKTWY